MTKRKIKDGYGFFGGDDNNDNNYDYQVNYHPHYDYYGYQVYPYNDDLTSIDADRLIDDFKLKTREEALVTAREKAKQLYQKTKTPIVYEIFEVLWNDENNEIADLQRNGSYLYDPDKVFGDSIKDSKDENNFEVIPSTLKFDRDQLNAKIADKKEDSLINVVAYISQGSLYSTIIDDIKNVDEKEINNTLIRYLLNNKYVVSEDEEYKWNSDLIKGV